jgi:cobyrinic acid a,c-diamide synthase
MPGSCVKRWQPPLPEVKVLGCIPRDEQLRIPSRHLGLVTAEENPLSEEFLNSLATVIGEQLDLDGLSVFKRNQGAVLDIGH